jgi:serine/threonine protein kinase
MADQRPNLSTVGSLPPCSFVDVGNDDLTSHPAIQRLQMDGVIGRVDRFELIRVIGRGGMGVVYQARDPERAEPVALKLLRPELSQHRRAHEFFLKEARHGTQLKHPNILPVLVRIPTEFGHHSDLKSDSVPIQTGHRSD